MKLSVPSIPDSRGLHSINASTQAGPLMDSRIVLLSVGLLVLAGCPDTYRVEPLSLEDAALVDRIQQELDEYPRIREAQDRVLTFARHLEGGDCQSAWHMLSRRYREGFAATAGGVDEARQLFCEGYLWKAGVVSRVDWTRSVLGPNPFYVTSPPPEIEVVTPEGEELFFVVQRDGSYTSFLLVAEPDGEGIEPF